MGNYGSGPWDLIPDGGFNEEENGLGGDGYHRSIYSGGYHGHMSWDTDPYGNYIPGSGHSTDHDSGEITDWGW